MHTPLNLSHSTSAGARPGTRLLRSAFRRTTQIFATMALVVAIIALLAWPISKFRHITYEPAYRFFGIADGDLGVVAKQTARPSKYRTGRGWTIRKPPATRSAQAWPYPSAKVSRSDEEFEAVIPLAAIAITAALASIGLWTFGRARTWMGRGVILGAAVSLVIGAAWALSLGQTMTLNCSNPPLVAAADAGRFLYGTLPPPTPIGRTLDNAILGRNRFDCVLVPRNTFGAMPTNASIWTPRFHSMTTGTIKQSMFFLPIWMPFAATAIPTLALAWWSKRKRSTPGHCPNCNYNLTGNQSNKCPECGTPVPAKQSPVQPQRSQR